MGKGAMTEVSFSLVAAATGTLAAVSGFVGVYIGLQQEDLMRRPAVHLACRPEFRLAEIAQNIKPPDDVLLLTESGAQWIHLGGNLPSSKDATNVVVPQPFARCEIKNFGRLPVLDVRIPLTLAFSAGGQAGTKSVDTALDVPGLSPDASYDFSLMNGSQRDLGFRFGRTMELTRVDTKGAVAAPLFADPRVAELERVGVRPEPAPSARAASAGTMTVVIRDFLFTPKELQVSAGTTVTFANHDEEAHELVGDDKSFDSGAIDPHSSWRHTFSTPGRYKLHCDYHPYMVSVVVVK
jgi:plastocyanin